MELKGQMLHLPESNSIMFLGSPRVDRLEELMGRGLHLSDIPMHDATRDVILVGVSSNITNPQNPEMCYGKFSDNR